MKRVLHTSIRPDGSDYAYMAIIIIRQNIKGARREEHEYYADDTADLWNHAIEFLAEGFSVISIDLYEVS